MTAYGNVYLNSIGSTNKVSPYEISDVVRSLVDTGIPGSVAYPGFITTLGLAAWRAGPWRHVAMAWWIHLTVEAMINGHGRNRSNALAMGLILALYTMAWRATAAESDPGMRGSRHSPQRSPAR